jgi:hypothetical protein
LAPASHRHAGRSDLSEIRAVGASPVQLEDRHVRQRVTTEGWHCATEHAATGCGTPFFFAKNLDLRCCDGISIPLGAEKEMILFAKPFLVLNFPKWRLDAM